VLQGRKRLATTLTGMLALGVLLVPAPSQAEPDIDDVRAKVDRLYHEGEVATERYHDAKLKLTDLRKDLAALKADEKAQASEVSRIQSMVDEAVASQYEGQALSATGELFLSDDPRQFLDELTTVDAYNGTQADVMAEYAIESEALEIRREAVAERAAELKRTEQVLAEEKAKADEKLAEAEEVLAELEAEERAELAAQASRGSSSRVPTNIDVPASGRASAAVEYALAQVGDAYVYGASGPSAFDCSGLTMMAWAQAGVGLPHSSGAQMGSGAPVSSGSLQPGDLVFYYSPVSHVGIYIGNGQIVHAANPSTGVQVAPVFSMPYSGAVRPG
jgi:cell wall-associated NlpC family hydrolase